VEGAQSQQVLLNAMSILLIAKAFVAALSNTELLSTNQLARVVIRVDGLAKLLIAAANFEVGLSSLDLICLGWEWIGWWGVVDVM
jgi:hypothetical protein